MSSPPAIRPGVNSSQDRRRDFTEPNNRRPGRTGGIIERHPGSLQDHTLLKAS